MKVGLYARVSSERQAQQGTIDSQTAALHARALADGHTIPPHDVYVDDGFSGTTLRRPALEQLRDRVAEGGLDILYVHSPDRLARKYAYQVLLLEELGKCGVTTVFLNGRSGQTAEDELLVQVQGVIAEYERTKIVERTRRGRIHRARQGSVSVMARAPYGYMFLKKSDESPASYRVLLHEAKVVRGIFRSLVREQKSMGEIARALNAANTPTRNAASGSKWHPSTIRAIVLNSTYVGKAAFGKTECVEPRPTLRPRRGKKTTVPRRAKSGHRHKPKDEWILIDVPAIVTQDIFEAAQEQLARNKQFAQRNGNDGEYLLSGLTVCAGCGYAFTGKTTRRRSDLVFRYYVCSGTSTNRFPSGRVCWMSVVRSDQLDGYVWQSVSELLLNPERVLGEWSRRQKSEGVTAEVRARRDEAARDVAACERNLKRLVDAYEAAAIELGELKTRSDAVRARLQRAQREAREADQALHQTTELREIITHLEKFADRVRKGIDELSWHDRRDIVRLLVARVEIDGEGATVVYRVPAIAGNPDETPSGCGSMGPQQGAALTARPKVARSSEDGSPRAGNCRLRTRRHRMLSSELESSKSASAQMIPKRFLGGGGSFAKPARPFGLSAMKCHDTLSSRWRSSTLLEIDASHPGRNHPSPFGRRAGDIAVSTLARGGSPLGWPTARGRAGAVAAASLGVAARGERSVLEAWRARHAERAAEAPPIRAGRERS